MSNYYTNDAKSEVKEKASKASIVVQTNNNCDLFETGSYFEMLYAYPQIVMEHIRKRDLPLSNLDLPARVYNTLKLCGINYLSEFVLMN